MSITIILKEDRYKKNLMTILICLGFGFISNAHSSKNHRQLQRYDENLSQSEITQTLIQLNKKSKLIIEELRVENEKEDITGVFYTPEITKYFSTLKKNLIYYTYLKGRYSNLLDSIIKNNETD